MQNTHKKSPHSVISCLDKDGVVVPLKILTASMGTGTQQNSRKFVEQINKTSGSIKSGIEYVYEGPRNIDQMSDLSIRAVRKTL